MIVFNFLDVIAILSLLIILVIFIIFQVVSWFKYRNCTHDTYFETMACEAICRTCGKNLGFIGTVREERKKRDYSS